jgi:hypothetical protein
MNIGEAYKGISSILECEYSIGGRSHDTAEQLHSLLEHFQLNITELELLLYNLSIKARNELDVEIYILNVITELKTRGTTCQEITRH